MAQIELEEQDLEKIDELVKNGMFHNREDAIKGILELSLEEIKRIEKIKDEINSFLEIYMGNMLYPAAPVKVIIDEKEMYKFPIKSASVKNGLPIFYAYVDLQTMEIDVNLSTNWESLPHMSDEELEKLEKIQMLANNYCENHLDDMCADVPLLDALEGREFFRVPVKGEYQGKTYFYGYLFIDAETLAIEELLFNREKIREIETTKHDNTTI